MRIGILFMLLILFASCEYQELAQNKDLEETTDKVVPSISYDISEVFLNRRNSLWQFKSDSANVSGFVNANHTEHQKSLEFGVVDGKKEGQLMAYFPNGRVRHIENYRNNKLHGEVKRWTTESGYQLLAHLSYESGKLHGTQRKWFPTGELHKVLQMKHGKEDGLQKAYRKNGALYANYEARDGRTFGLKRSNLCYELDDQQVVYKQ